ncbi:YitT family protein [Dendrosporobacter sp. 1207_IL3150]|uniref:YitT family protein n=1 Tax=Dendrosporobacter sp. 1207_IL3150 TaxID=3084054 RepID=UPI002FDA1986
MGCLLASIGVVILRHSHLVTGGTPGLALSLSYITGLSFAASFFWINVPFYVLSFIRMGWQFTLYTLLAVNTLSLLTSLDHLLPYFWLPDWLGAIIGGLFVGCGLSVLFLNGASLGGVTILVLYLHQKLKWDVGKITFAFDFLIVMSGVYSVGFFKGLSSVLSIIVIASVISFFRERISEKVIPADTTIAGAAE